MKRSWREESLLTNLYFANSQLELGHVGTAKMALDRVIDAILSGAHCEGCGVYLGIPDACAECLKKE